MLQQNEVCRKSQNQLDDSRKENEVDCRLDEQKKQTQFT